MQTEPKFVRALAVAAWLTALVPLSYVASLYAFVIRNRLLLGHWPSEVEQASLAPGFDLHDDITYLLGMATLGATLAVPAFAAGCALIKADSRAWGRILLPVTGAFGLALLVLLADPGGFRSWFYDQMDERAKQHYFRANPPERTRATDNDTNKSLQPTGSRSDARLPVAEFPR